MSVPAKAVFLDRDGVINEIVYYRELGLVDSPRCARQFRLLPHAAEGIRLLNQAGFKVIVVTNQPGIAKKSLTRRALREIHGRMTRMLRARGARLDAIYCCLHHPEAKIQTLRQVCECRKPGCGLLLAAARDWSLDLPRSFMVGDSFTDIEAGHAAGCRTIFVGRWKCEACQLMGKDGARPDILARDLSEAAQLILRGAA
jgi:histidinol-phosphate phosphatase family protein